MAASFSESASFVSSFLQVLKTEVVVRESFFKRLMNQKEKGKKEFFTGIGLTSSFWLWLAPHLDSLQQQWIVLDPPC